MKVIQFKRISSHKKWKYRRQIKSIFLEEMLKETIAYSIDFLTAPFNLY